MRVIVGVVVSLFATRLPAGDDTSRPPAINTQTALNWSALPDLPDEFGFGGPIVGVNEGVLIVAGGANFPGGPPWPVGNQPPGTKVWHDRIFALLSNGGEWIEVGRLPAPRAYAAVVSTKDGIFVVGGESSRIVEDDAGRVIHEPFNVADVLRLRWNATSQTIEIEEDIVPPLPIPCSYHGVGVIGTTLYVVASHASSEESLRLDESAFWSIDLAAALDNSPDTVSEWLTLPPCPGAPREKMAIAMQTSGADDRFGSQQCLYVISGSTWVKNAEGVSDPALWEYFTDGYRYSPRSNEWSPIADLPAVPEMRFMDLSLYDFDADQGRWMTVPDGETGFTGVPTMFDAERRPAVASPCIAVGQSHILLFSGDEGRYLTIPHPDRMPFPREVLAYHTITDTWTIVGEMPIGVVTTSAVEWNGGIVIPSGEVQPAVRTPKVQMLELHATSRGFGTLNWTVLIGYLTILVAIGIYFSRRENATDDYFLAGRRIPWWAAGLSIYVTQLSALTYLSLPALAYGENWLTFPGQWSILLVAPLVIACYLPFFRRLNVTTAYEYLERRFNLPVRLYGSLSFIIYQLGRMSIVVFLPALALSAVTGMNVYVAIVIMGVLSTLYTVLGGMEAVIWTDVAQAIVLWGGLFAMLAVVVADVGGLAPLIETAQQGHKLTMFNWNWQTTEMAAWLILLGNIGNQLGPYTVDQAVIQRYLTTKDEAAAARGIWLNGILAIPFSALFLLLGAGLYVYYQSHSGLLEIGADRDSIVPRFVVESLPAGVAGLVIAGVFAATMSSLDSSMHSVATALTTDFYRRFRPAVPDGAALKFAKWTTAIVGIIGTVLAMVLVALPINSLFLAFQKLLGLVTSGVAGVFVLAIFTRRANSIGVLIGAIASFALLLIVSNTTHINLYLYSLIGIGTTVAVGYVTSLAIPTSSRPLDGLTWWDLKAESSKNRDGSPTR